MNRPSPLDSIFGLLTGLPKGQDKPLKQALYNAVAIFVMVLCCTAGWGLYHILQPFIKPLMWAVLVGSALHPLKRSLRDKFRNWFITLEETNTPAVFGIVLLPLNIFNEFSDCVGTFLQQRLKLILGICSSIALSLLLYHFTPRFLLSLLWNGTILTINSLNCFINATSVTLVSLILVSYLSFVFLVWKPENNVRFHYVSVLVWLLAISCFSGLFGVLQMPIFVVLLCVFFGGFIWEVLEAYTEMNSTDHSISFTDLLLHVFHDKPLEIDVNEEEISETSSENKKPQENDVKNEEAQEPPIEAKDAKKVSTQVKWADGDNTPKSKSTGDHLSPDEQVKNKLWRLELFDGSPEKANRNVSDGARNLNRPGVLITEQGIHLIQGKKEKPMFSRSVSQPHFNVSRLRRANALSIIKKSPSRTESYESSYYLYTVFWSCVLMIFCKNHMFIPLLTIPVVYYALKHLGKYLGVWTYIYENLEILFTKISEWFIERHDALVPVPIRGLYKFLEKANTIIKNSIKDSIDTVASCVVIIGIIVFVICASVFIIVQIYAETILLVQLTGNAINQTVVQNPELRQLLPPTWDDTLDSLLDNAYQYGREGISKTIKGIMTDVDSAKSAKLEQQVLELWDRAYQSWMSSDDGSNGPKVTDDAVKNSWESFIADIQKSPEIFNLNSIMEFGKQNVGTLLTLLDSIWGILVNNVSLILTSFSTCVSILLGGGTAVLNFLLNMVVFLTTLFYLLSSSGENYKPVELTTKFSSSSRRFGYALEGAINSVFSASFKMAVFYGLYTWFIHNLFGVKIVYLPSAFATILGAVPFLGTYWACVPAVLDLWLAQDRWISAILFAAVQFFPTNFVDTAIYSEIKGGHPYLTGLAIAGGIFCLGVEGAIIGPLLLCGLYVGIDLSSSFFKDSPIDEGMRNPTAKENE